MCYTPIRIDFLLVMSILIPHRVPHFPEEDTKLRAKSMKRRRGGNTGNTLEVLSQLLPDDNFNSETLTYHTELSLLTVLPDPTSLDTKAVIASLPDVSPRLFQYRAGQQSAASSYIIFAPNGTRTIVSYNPLDEMTFEEFRFAIRPLVTEDTMKEEVWIHFEGRNPEVVNACVTWLRNTYGYNRQVAISIELEKPDRWVLEKSAKCADVIFYSKLWAEVSDGSLPNKFALVSPQTHPSPPRRTPWCPRHLLNTPDPKHR